MTQAMSDVRCVVCGGANMSSAVSGIGAFQCNDCQAEYGLVWGVPFFGNYEADDILGLVEIAANAGNRGKFGVTPEVVEDWERLLASYHQASDKPAFVRNNSQAQSPFLLNRYGEWVEITHLTRDMNLQGWNVLDIGAGLGFDSHRLAERGAHVTALEFSPLLAEAGNINFPHIRWIGGFSHVLPFRNGSFDAVFCNAALHHMRDIPAAISEALRVLRPGGLLITTCDSFCPSAAKDDAELEIFDGQPSVLLGVNEGIPRFSEFASTFSLHPELLEVEIFTHTLYGDPSGGTLTEFMPWNFAKDSGMLSKHSGSLALRVRLNAPWPEPAKLQADAVLTPARYAEWLTSESSAIAKLASLMPDSCIDLPFPGGRGSKFELLNGWRLQKPFQHARTAYRRGRWFIRRPEIADALVFEAGLVNSSNTAEGSIQVLLDGHIVCESRLMAGSWTRVLLDLSGIPPSHVFAVEILKLGGDDSLDGAAFVVRSRRFVTSHGIGEIRASTRQTLDEHPTVFAVIPVFNRLHFTLACIRFLKAQTYAPLRIIVADGGSTDGSAESIRAAFPDVVVLTAKEELWWAGSMAAGIDYALHESRSDTDLVLMMNNDTEIPADYVSTLVAASQHFDAAVGSLIVDSRDETHVLDAGEYVRWSPYSFPVKTVLGPAERFCDDVDVLPGRGSLVPLRMIRAAGNVDARRFPHYLADYEFFYRLKRQGFRLGVCYETTLRAHIEETGIVPSADVASVGEVLREAFSRRSMINIVDHWRFISLYAPRGRKPWLWLRLIVRLCHSLAMRTTLRWIAKPVWFVISGVVRLLLFSVRPGPIDAAMIVSEGLTPEDLIAAGVVRGAAVDGWYIVRWRGLVRLLRRNVPNGRVVARLIIKASNPILKVRNWLALRKASQAAAGASGNEL